MPRPKPIALDPARLLVLAKSRDTRRALVRDLGTRYQDQRELLTDVKRQAAFARENAIWLHGVDRSASLERAAKLEARVEEIRSGMAEVQREIDLRGAEAAQAAQLLAECLKAAKAEGLEIPRELAADAAERPDLGGL